MPVPDESVVRTLFERLLAAPDADRPTLLAQAKSTHPREAAEVESLLRHHARRDALLDRPAAHAAPPEAIPATLSAPRTIGRYAIGVELGRGGMGVVYEALQDSPRRRVALKVVRPDLVTSTMLKRLAHEAEVLGRLRHPGIAQIYEAGTAPDDRGVSRTFLAMELVRGRPILAAADARRLSIKQRMELVAGVCDAIDHAHRRGVIHRDLKPGNILVEEEVSRDSTGSLGGLRVKVLDFGIARLVEDPAAAATAATSAGQVVGTLAYMSPEQAAGDAAAVDTRSDVYSLGAVLYELLCGAPALNLRDTTLMGALTIIREREPMLAGRLRPTLKGDPEAILAKALEKDPARRYASAAEFAADIRRCLGDEPVLAHPQTTWYQVRKFARRHRVPVVAAMALVLALSGGIIGTSWQAIRAGRQRAIAEEQRTRAQQSAAFLQRMLRAATPQISRGRELTVRDMLAEADRQLARDRDIHPAVAADTHMTLAEAYAALGDHAASARHADEAHTLFVSLSGPESDPAFRALSTRALALSNSGRAPEARALCEEAIPIAERLFGPTHIVTIDLINALHAALYYAKPPRHEECVRVARLAHQRAVIGLGPDHPSTIQMLQNLGRAKMAADGPVTSDETIDILSRVLASRRTAFGDDHPRTLSAAQNLARALWLRGRYQQVVDLLEPLMEPARRVLGTNHQTVITLHGVYAQGLHSVGRSKEAAVESRRSYDALVAQEGPLDPLTVVARQQLCNHLLAAGQCDDAEPVLREIEASLQTLGDAHFGVAVRLLRFDLARCKNDLAGMERALAALAGTPDEADARRAYSDALRALSPDGPAAAPPPAQPAPPPK